MDHVVLDLLAVGRDIAAFGIVAAIEVGLADVERIAPEFARDVVDQVLDGDRALRPAEAAESGVGLGIGLAAQRADVDVGQVVGIVEMADRARCDRARQVGRIAGAATISILAPRMRPSSS
jgi:hypothetical protein